MASIAFLPALPFPASMYDQVGRDLGVHHDVHLIDTPGFGERAGELPEDGLSFDGYVAAAVAELLDLPGPLVLCGTSFGGQLAIQIAAREPQLVSALVLSNTGAGLPGAEGKQTFETAAAAAEEHGSAALIEQFLPMILSPVTLDSRPDVVGKIEGMISSAPRLATASGFRAVANRPDPAEALARVDCPVLLSFGIDDKLSPISEAETMEGILDKAVTNHIEGAAHIPSLETSMHYSQALIGFLEAEGL